MIKPIWQSNVGFLPCFALFFTAMGKEADFFSGYKYCQHRQTATVWVLEKFSRACGNEQDMYIFVNEIQQGRST